MWSLLLLATLTPTAYGARCAICPAQIQAPGWTEAAPVVQWGAYQTFTGWIAACQYPAVVGNSACTYDIGTGAFTGRIAFADVLVNPYGAWRFQIPTTYGADICPPSISTVIGSPAPPLSVRTVCEGITGSRQKCKDLISKSNKQCDNISKTGGWLGLPCPGITDGIQSTALGILGDLQKAAEDYSKVSSPDPPTKDEEFAQRVARAQQIVGILIALQKRIILGSGKEFVKKLLTGPGSRLIPAYGQYCAVADIVSGLGSLCSIRNSLFDNYVCNNVPERKRDYGYPPVERAPLPQNISVTTTQSISFASAVHKRSDNACRDFVASIDPSICSRARFACDLTESDFDDYPGTLSRDQRDTLLDACSAGETLSAVYDYLCEARGAFELAIPDCGPGGIYNAAFTGDTPGTSSTSSAPPAASSSSSSSSSPPSASSISSSSSPASPSSSSASSSSSFSSPSGNPSPSPSASTSPSASLSASPSASVSSSSSASSDSPSVSSSSVPRSSSSSSASPSLSASPSSGAISSSPALSASVQPSPSSAPPGVSSVSHSPNPAPSVPASSIPSAPTPPPQLPSSSHPATATPSCAGGHWVAGDSPDTPDSPDSPDGQPEIPEIPEIPDVNGSYFICTSTIYPGGSHTSSAMTSLSSVGGSSGKCIWQWVYGDSPDTPDTPDSPDGQPEIPEIPEIPNNGPYYWACV